VTNPFVIDRPLSPQEIYFGRDSEYRQLLSHIQAGERLIVVFGRPKCGKTSFLLQASARLADRYVFHLIDWPMDDSPTGPWETLAAVFAGTAMPEGVEDRDGVLSEALRAELTGPTVVAIDALDANALLDEDQALRLGSFARVLDSAPYLTVILCIGLPPGAAQKPAALDVLPSVMIQPLSRDDSEQLLTVLTRGRLSFSNDAIQEVHRLCGGEPYYLQLMGHTLFKHRARAGWVGLPEVEQAVPTVVQAAAPLFAAQWESLGEIPSVIVAALADMVGTHGMPSVADVARHLGRMNVHLPADELQSAVSHLSAVDALETLGGHTARFRCGIFRTWIRNTHPLLAVLATIRRFRSAREGPLIPALPRRIDWVAVLLWALASVLALVIIYVWRSRESQVFWTVTPTVPIATVASPGSSPTAQLPTPESGVAPGHMAYVSRASADELWDVYIMRSDGSDPVRLTVSVADDTAPVISPDGRRIAFVSTRDGNREVYVMNNDGNEQINLTNSPAEDWTPTWAPDGLDIAFASFRDGNWEIYVMDAMGNYQERLTRNTSADYSPAWSPDGRSIAFVSNRDGNLEIYVLDIESGQEKRITKNEATDQTPSWSPDGSQIVWESYRDGNMEIYVASSDGSGAHSISQDSLADDHGATWSPWGRRIAFFTNRDGGWDIYTLDVESGERVNITMSPAVEQNPHWGR